jgi:glutaminyl-peptide cyclotransferase
MKILILLSLALFVCGCGDKDGGNSSATPFNAERAMQDVVRQVELGPRPSGSKAQQELAEIIASELKESQLKKVTVQEPYQNIHGTIPGIQPGIVIVGTHYDTYDQEGFVGANDGASGVAVLLELARVLKEPKQTVMLVFFDKEEARPGHDFGDDGTQGSQQFTRYMQDKKQNTPAPNQVEAMILLDMIGDCDLQIPREANSDPELYQWFADDDVFSGETGPIEDDHLPFLELGIPAVNLIDFTYGSSETPGPYWHTGQDTLDKVCPESLGLVGDKLYNLLTR